MSAQRRRPFGLALVVLVATVPFLAGVWMPRWYVPPDEPMPHSVSLFAMIVELAPSVLPIVLLAFAGAGAVGGARGVREGLSFLLGSVRAGRDLVAHRALSCAARSAIGAGLLVSLVGMLHLFRFATSMTLGDDPPNPADIAGALTTIMIAPLFGLVVGRLVLAPAAAAAAVRAGEPERATSPIAAELALFALIVPIVTAFYLVLTPYPL